MRLEREGWPRLTVALKYWPEEFHVEGEGSRGSLTVLEEGRR